ncbi:unnamed protein product [Caenorhabditis auriculariae]|uniref:Aspartic peptidase DDI1-type domain-containing protein n=1 Tax=Caenorhabditis auriculariae TaxID=2777116 RepID=A0A8S1HCL1_9PELO|nr:unnamed protein product [Caenorhabditis auriculariae]
MNEVHIARNDNLSREALLKITTNSSRITIAEVAAAVAFEPFLIWNSATVVYDISRGRTPPSIEVLPRESLYVYSQEYVASKGGSTSVLPLPMRQIIERFSLAAALAYEQARPRRRGSRNTPAPAPSSSSSASAPSQADVTRLLQELFAGHQSNVDKAHARKVFDALNQNKGRVLLEYPEFVEKFNKLPKPVTFEAYLPLYEEWVTELERQERVMRDPTSAEGQRLIQEKINQQRLNEQWATAMEHHPESLIPVTMLYVNLSINNVPVKAFIDSGAQVSIMSEECAQRCNLTGLIDKRFKGVARGVGGEQRFIGKIHLCDVKVEQAHFACPFDVLADRQMDLLVGLNVLRRHNCCINLARNRLEFGDGTSTPFLQSNEIDQHLQNVVGILPDEDKMDTTEKK